MRSLCFSQIADLRIIQRQVIGLQRQYFARVQSMQHHEAHGGQIAGSAKTGPKACDPIDRQKRRHTSGTFDANGISTATITSPTGVITTDAGTRTLTALNVIQPFANPQGHLPSPIRRVWSDGGKRRGECQRGAFSAQSHNPERYSPREHRTVSQHDSHETRGSALRKAVMMSIPRPRCRLRPGTRRPACC